VQLAARAGVAETARTRRRRNIIQLITAERSDKFQKTTARFYTDSKNGSKVG
jgi:hypothetical protein